MTRAQALLDEAAHLVSRARIATQRAADELRAANDQQLRIEYIERRVQELEGLQLVLIHMKNWDDLPA